MNASAYSEDQMLQAGTAEFFEEHLGWTTEFAFDREDYGPASLLGRSHRGEVVLVRELRKALHRLNPKAPIQIEPAKDAKEEPAKASLTERDLYPLLCRYLHTEFGLYPQRIDEKRSSNRNGPKGNIWLFPDIVALEDLGAEGTAKIELPPLLAYIKSTTWLSRLKFSERLLTTSQQNIGHPAQTILVEGKQHWATVKEFLTVQNNGSR